MASARWKQIAASLQDKEYRQAFVAAQISNGLPFQIRSTREDRGWTQCELAERVGMSQEAISRLESFSYGKFTLQTLKRLAAAFDVALVVRFVPFSEIVDWSAKLSPGDLAVPDFDHDPGFTTQRASEALSEFELQIVESETRFEPGWRFRSTTSSAVPSSTIGMQQRVEVDGVRAA